MHFKQRSLARAMSAIGAGTLTTFGMALVAHAQQPAQPRVEKIEVTGSNIKRVDAETVAPVTVITREDIEKSGKQTISEVLRELPQNGGQSYNETFTNSFSPGASGIALRGLGQKATLVLINGRRMANYGFAQNLFDTYVDLNSIPAGAVERIEILKDGASAVYGSDAIGGVVNVILRRDYKGGEISGNFGTSHEGGLDETRASLGIGFGDMAKDRYNVLATFDYFKRTELLFSDRGSTKDEDYRNLPGGTLGWITYGAYPTGTGLLTRVPISTCPPAFLVAANQLNALLNGTSCAYNAASQQSLFPASERLGFLGRATFEFSPTLQGFAELSLSSNESKQTFTPVGLGSATLTFNPENNGVRVISNVLPVGNPSNPFAAPTRILYTFTDVGTRDAKIESDSYRMLAGLKGAFGSWDWEGAFVKAENEASQISFNRVNAIVLRDAIANGTYNFLNPSAGTVTANDLRINPKRDSESKLDGFDFKVFSEIAQLPAGPLGFAAGIDYRKESLKDTPDPLLTGGFVLAQGSTFTTGERNSKAVFVEFAVPVTKDIEAQVAARYDRYSDFGAATSPKFGLKWAPRRDFLMRTSIGRGFRAPTLPEASVSNNVSFNNVNDPAFNNAVFSVGALSVSNPNLKPERSRNFSVGMVFEPTNDFNFGMDFYKIEQNNIVSRETPNSIIFQNFQGNPAYANLVVRNPDTGTIIYVVRQVQNFALVETSGMDFDYRWRMSAGEAGKLTLTGNWNFLRRFKVASIPGSTATDRVDSNSFGTNPRYRGNTTLTWDKGNWSTALTYRYVHSYDQVFVAAQARVGHYKDYDLFVAYNGFKNLRLTASVRNLLDTTPPWDASSQGNGGFDFQTTDLRGRYFNLGAKYTFK